MSIVVVIVAYLYSYSCPYYLCYFYDAYRIICMIAIKKAAISAVSLERCFGLFRVEAHMLGFYRGLNIEAYTIVGAPSC